MRPIFVVVLTPVVDRLPCLSEGEKPVLIQTLLSQSAVEAFDESIVSRLAWAAELELHAVAMSPGIERLRDEFAAVVDFDCLWQAVLFQVAAKIKGIKSATWDLLLLSKIIDPRSIDNEDNIKLVRRYLPNAYIRSKATLLGTLVLSRGISAFGPWRDAVIRGMQGDEPAKVDPYLPEVFETAQRPYSREAHSVAGPAISLLESFFHHESQSANRFNRRSRRLPCYASGSAAALQQWQVIRLSLLVLAPCPQHLH